jgi:type IV pilus assembly protein PilQ
VTIIIAGLIQDNKTRTDNKLPYLGDLPIVGNLFKNKSDTLTRTETVVFLTPRIVEGNKSFLYLKDLPKKSKGPKA